LSFVAACRKRLATAFRHTDFIKACDERLLLKSSVEKDSGRRKAKKNKAGSLVFKVSRDL